MSRIGVLVSGEGTNLQALIDAGLPISCVASNKPGARALDRADRAGIETAVFDAADYPSREERDTALAAWLGGHDVDLVCVNFYPFSAIVRLVAAREDAAVDARMQRLHAPAEHLGCVRHLLDQRHRESGFLEEGRGLAARHELEAEVRQPARELLQTALVVHGDQSAHSSPTT